MDSCSPLAKSTLQPVHWASSSLKKETPQDESDEATKFSEEACSTNMQQKVCLSNTSQKFVPVPPALPSPGFLNKKSASIHGSNQKSESTRAGYWIPKEVAETWDRLFFEGNAADVSVITEDSGSFKVHSIILMSASPVFQSMINKHRATKTSTCKIVVSGVPCAAASMFMRLIYSSRYDHADMEKYVLHLLVLAHVYSVPFIKHLCTHQLEQGLLTVENVIDVLQLARLCDVPRLNLMCLRLIINNFMSVARTEGWRVMREVDPSLEQELVEHVIDADTKRQERIRKIEEEKVYGQLRDAMEALVHICRDGCRTIGPHDKAFDGKQAGPCNFPACKGLESLVRHFAGCRIKVPGGCVHCKRMWQLLELHSRLCQEVDTCRVPLCRHFKEKLGQQNKKDENKWKLLVTKVMTAKRKVNGFSLATVSARLAED